MSTRQSPYPDVPSNPDFPELEQDILKFWQDNAVFEASVEARPTTAADGSDNEYVFYDGPPFANGLPHHGHLLTGFVKDLFPRYHTMKGRRVERRFGWDCHGLPAEMEAEKELKISGRKNIMEYGIRNFNEFCRTSVMKYAGEWEWYVNRQARWVDFENDYKTMDTPFMESVIWAFSELNKKGLIYEGFKVMPYSWSAETVLSSSEIRLDDATREKEDKAITVAFKLERQKMEVKFRELEKTFKELGSSFSKRMIDEFHEYNILAWTTTPWTLPSNLALAVHADQEYWFCKSVKEPGVCYIIIGPPGDNYREWIGKEDTDHKVEVPLRVRGEFLLGLTYEPLFPYFVDTPNAFRILDGSSFIEEGSGTGVVHMAPGFGEDDQRVCAENNIPTLVPVDGEGRFTDAIFDLPNVKICHPERSEGSHAAGDSSPTAHNDSTAIETARCTLRAPTPEDEHYFITLHTNAQVMETMNDGVMTEAEAKADFAANLAHFKEHGYGQWLVFNKDSGAFMGRTGLSFLAQSPEMPAAPTLRCGLLPDFWQSGYGSELCHASLAYGFLHRKFERIVAGAHGDNPRAHRMMERLGMTVEKEVMFKRVRGPYFVMSRDEFLSKHPPLSLRGLNVIKETQKFSADDPFKAEQLEKFGLANMRIIKWLKARNRLVNEELYKHNYPHCWRTDQPIIYRAMSSWFVDVPKIRDRMVELNQQINWIPAHVKDGRFGKWIENAREWSISRSRFWGCPIPVWRSDNPNNKELYIFGSIAELEAFFGQTVEDLHRPYIDELTKPDPHDPQYTIRRVEEVFDCWFESGSMPYAQVHYMGEKTKDPEVKKWFDNHFPAQFIVEYEAQTRGWFYNMFVLSVALFDKIPFENCICHGVVLDDKGRKLSKRLKNYMDPKVLFEKYGSDALRWFMMSSSIMRGSELLLDPDGKFIHDAIRLYIKPIWNAYNFFTLYANADGVKGELLYCHPERSEGSPAARDSSLIAQNDSLSLFDRYILAKCREMVEAVEKALDAYDTPSATQAITDFVEVLNNWYIRRNKDRFWKAEHDADKQAAYDTLYTVLHILCRTAAPLLPMVTEAVWQGLVATSSRDSIAGSQATSAQAAIDPAIKSRDDGAVSVHLANWPDMSAVAEEAELIRCMDRVRDICNTALSIRNDAKIRVRQPLELLKVVGEYRDVILTDELAHIIKDEVNVHEVALGSIGLREYADYKLKLNNQILGKRLPEKMKQIIPASKKGEWDMKDSQLHICGETLLPEEYELNLEPKPGIKGAAATSTNDALVVLDLTITPELEAEGRARDLVRMIQQARKDAGLNIADRIALVVDLPDTAGDILGSHEKYISEQTLAVSLTRGAADQSAHRSAGELDGVPVTIGLSVAA